MDENRKLAVQKQYLEYLRSFISSNKRNLFMELIQFRTRHLCVALENIYQPHNASAVLRSCDCFGIQDVHIIENTNTYDVNPDVALGSSKWLNLIYHNSEEHNTLACINKLKQEGYLVLATSPNNYDYLLKDVPLDHKTALLFGTELQGLSDIALEHADARMKIPMYGFTESFNISVSAAICLYKLTESLHQSGINWKLSEAEKVEIMIGWAEAVLKKPETYKADYISRTPEASLYL